MLVIPDNQGIEVFVAWRIAANDKLLALVDAHLHPGTRPQPRLISAVPPLGNQALKPLGFD